MKTTKEIQDRKTRARARVGGEVTPAAGGMSKSKMNRIKYQHKIATRPIIKGHNRKTSQGIVEHALVVQFNK